jgi:hypothetical protein
MKNPFKKEDSNAALVALIAIGAIAAGAITYLYLKRKSIVKRRKDEAKEHAGDYLKPHNRKKKRTTDVHELEQIVGKAL